MNIKKKFENISTGFIELTDQILVDSNGEPMINTSNIDTDSIPSIVAGIYNHYSEQMVKTTTEKLEDMFVSSIRYMNGVLAFDVSKKITVLIKPVTDEVEFAIAFNSNPVAAKRSDLYLAATDLGWSSHS